MTEQPGLFALPGPPSAPPARAPRDRGRRGEHWTRTVVADLHIVDSRALREATYRLLSESITINLGPADDDPDLLDDPRGTGHFVDHSQLTVNVIDRDPGPRPDGW